MSVFYRLHQDQSTGTKRSGKWYARAVPMAVVDTRKLAEIVQRNCTVKLSDVLAVIAELVETMRDQLQDSKRVKLDGFGSFKIGIESKGAQTANKSVLQSTSRGCTLSSPLSVALTPAVLTPNSSFRAVA